MPSHSTSSPPLATYGDKSHFGKRAYELYADKVRVHHHDSLQRSGEVTLRLTDLDPDYEKTAVRSQFFFAGIWLMIVPWLIYWALIELTRLDRFDTFPGLFLALGFAGFFMMVVGLKRQQFIRFKTMSGVPALDIFREGPRRKEFDGFVSALIQAILDAKASASR